MAWEGRSTKSIGINSLFVRRTLHLNRTCADAYIHAPIREGGLGVLSLRQHIPAILYRRMVKILMMNDDNDMAYILEMRYTRKFWDRLIKWTRQHAGNRRLMAQEWSRRLEEGYSGNGLSQDNLNGDGKGWINHPPRFWSGGDYVRAA